MSLLDDTLAGKAEVEQALLVVLKRVQGAGRAGYAMTHPVETVSLNALARAGLVTRTWLPDHGRDNFGYGTYGQWIWNVTAAGRAKLREAKARGDV